MTIAEMHYEFKRGLNRLDSSKYQDLLIPQIDIALNEAQDVFIKMIASPRTNTKVGFELGQRTIDDIRTIVIDQRYEDGVTPTIYDSIVGSYLAKYPENYYFYVGSDVYGVLGDTKVKMRRAIPIQHNDENEESILYKSSFNWREVNIEFSGEGLLVFTNNSFDIDKVCFKYLREPLYMHNAQDFNGDLGYVSLNGQQLMGRQDCELPKTCHRDLVDLAVFLSSIDLNTPDSALKQRKLGITN